MTTEDSKYNLLPFLSEEYKEYFYFFTTLKIEWEKESTEQKMIDTGLILLRKIMELEKQVEWLEKEAGVYTTD